MTGHVRPAIEQPMIGNVRVVSRCVPLPAFAKVFPVVSLSGNSRSICWAASLASPRAPALYRAANTGRKGTSALPPLPEASLQNLLDVESRILRSFSAEAALDTKDAAVVEEPSRALAVHEQERSVKKSRKEWSRAASREPSLEGRILDDSVHCIRHQDIPRGVWTALLKLRGAGHEAFLVGGAVRDMLLGRKPKDFDVLTTATPVQVKRHFSKCQIVGSRFPIALVHWGGTVLEVSSFGTRAKRDTIPTDAAALLSWPPPHSKGASKRPAPLPAEQQHVRWSDARRANATSRDFTVNALMLDPFGLLVHDYTGGVRDCAKRVLRTIGSPTESFQLDPARMLRAVRHAARCGLSIDKGTAQAMEENRDLLLRLPSSRIRLEAEAFFGYGAAAASLQLLWRHKLLDILVPQLAERFRKGKVPRTNPMAAYRKEQMLRLLDDLDADMEATKPIHWTVWAAVMAAPLLDEALSELLKEEKAMLKARQGPSGPEQDGRRKKRRTKNKAAPVESSDQAEEAPQKQECSRCEGNGAAAHSMLRLAINKSVKQLTGDSGESGAQPMSILPTAQWTRAADLIRHAVEITEEEQSSTYICMDCQAKVPEKLKGSTRANLELLLDVLDARPAKWCEQKQRLAACLS
ncbi:hypothetical protein CVIRNUC_000770 [Coccomyxa viridis]|uniref:Uncharacterized protein n=1 Tax=Coccomyxa viridis TaxID=1274662 RepID=A0AAV1HR89_9CHLO|nr:hypothetical protein CVIRNUC_000770 [Coccomyxa viridis]